MKQLVHVKTFSGVAGGHRLIFSKITSKCKLKSNIAFNLVMISNRLFVSKTKLSILYNIDIEGL